jgi:hypothetical protein
MAGVARQAKEDISLTVDSKLYTLWQIQKPKCPSPEGTKDGHNTMLAPKLRQLFSAPTAANQPFRIAHVVIAASIAAGL